MEICVSSCVMNKWVLNLMKNGGDNEYNKYNKMMEIMEDNETMEIMNKTKLWR